MRVSRIRNGYQLLQDTLHVLRTRTQLKHEADWNSIRRQSIKKCKTVIASCDWRTTLSPEAQFVLLMQVEKRLACRELSAPLYGVLYVNKNVYTRAEHWKLSILSLIHI